MEPHLQGIEVESVRTDDDDLAVDDTRRRQVGEERGVQFWEVSSERLEIAALDIDVRLAAEDARAKAVPLRFKQIVPGIIGDAFGHRGQHRLDPRLDGERRWGHAEDHITAT